MLMHRKYTWSLKVCVNGTIQLRVSETKEGSSTETWTSIVNICELEDIVVTSVYEDALKFFILIIKKGYNMEYICFY